MRFTYKYFTHRNCIIKETIADKMMKVDILITI